MGHSRLLSKADNKYQLVLEVAKRAKIIKDEIGKSALADTAKPIPTAIQEMVTADIQGLRLNTSAENLEAVGTGKPGIVGLPEIAKQAVESEETEETEEG